MRNKNNPDIIISYQKSQEITKLVSDDVGDMRLPLEQASVKCLPSRTSIAKDDLF